MLITGQGFLISQREFGSEVCDALDPPDKRNAFFGVHAAVCNLFNLGRHLVSAKNYRILRMQAFVLWKCVAALKLGKVSSICSDT